MPINETVVGQLIIFITLISGYFYNIYRENRNRRWDLEDRVRARAEIANTLKESEKELAKTTQIQQDKVLNKIEQNTQITKEIHKSTSELKESHIDLKALLAMYDAVGKRPPLDQSSAEPEKPNA